MTGIYPAGMWPQDNGCTMRMSHRIAGMLGWDGKDEDLRDAGMRIMGMFGWD